jgi:hypothetical protein
MVAEADYAATRVDLTGAHPESLRALGLPPTLNFDFVLFSESESPELAAFGVTDGDRPFVRANVLPDDATSMSASELHQDIYQKLASNPDIVLHEITHLLDYLRGGAQTMKQAPPAMPEGELTREQHEQFASEYINNPLEFNAHFQQGIFELRYAIRALPPGRKGWVKRSYPRFEALAFELMPFRALDHTSGKWRKKLHQRLWQTWRHWKDTGEL